MKLNCKDLNVSFDLREIVERLSDEERGLFFESVLFEEKLLRYFAEIATSDYAFDSGLYSTTYSSGKPIQRLAGSLRKIVLSNLNVTYKTEIEQMQKDLEDMAQKEKELFQKNWDLDRKVTDQSILIRELQERLKQKEGA